MDSCAACGCEIIGGQTSAGQAVHHAGKVYCAECAAMIIPPETLKQMAETAHPSIGLMPADDVLGEEVPGETASNPISDEPPPVPRRETAVVRGVRRPSTRAARMAARGGSRRNVTT